MGIYFNPGNGSFTSDSLDEYYVDKTGLLEELNNMLNTPRKFVALSHARRFGKSQAAGMIDAYYSLGSDSHNLFDHREIATYEDYEKHLNKYNVIHLDISSVYDFHKEDLVEECTRRIYDEIREIYPEIDVLNDINVVLQKIYVKSGIQFVIIIDEWDCVVRNMSDRPELVHKYLQFLHILFKSEESKQYIALAYITGILPIKKIKDESALNNFMEYTMVNSFCLAKYFGFTEGEVKALCNQYDMDFESIREWYDGYYLNGYHMYNPNSVYCAIVHRSLDSYWKNTSAFDTINTYVLMDYEGLKEDVLQMLEGKKVEVNVNTFKNDLSEIYSKDDALTALIHLGYLAYNKEEEVAYIPNYEVAMAYRAALQDNQWNKVAETIANCDKLLQCNT